MAGIGFNLQKILEGDTYLDSVKAHFYSALISSGPWIISILTLFSLTRLAPAGITLYEMMLFRAVIIYIFAFSLTVAGFFQLPVTRYLADKLYVHEHEALLPAFNTAVLMLLSIQTVIGVTAACFWEASMPMKILAVFIYLAISLLWLVMIFLTALRDYQAITLAFFTGGIVTVVCGFFLGERWGITGYFAGYLAGHLVTAVMLTARIYIEFESRRAWDWGLIPFMARNGVLVMIGLFYNLALWADKMAFWWSPRGVTVSSFFRVTPDYDAATFFAYLTMIPALSFFLIHLETDFYRRYRRYYLAIIDKSPLSVIRHNTQEMTKSLRRNLSFLVKYQGLICLLMIAFAQDIAAVLHLPWVQVPIFRITVLGAFLHSLLLISTIIVLYFDFRRLALFLVFLFMVLNGLFSAVTARMDLAWWGFGYLGACFLTLMAGFYGMDAKFRKLEYLTFAAQPVAAHREEEIV